MLHKLCSLLAVVWVVAMPVLAVEAPPAPTRLAVPASAGQEANGLKLVLQPLPDAWYTVGDPIPCRLTFINTSANLLSILVDAANQSTQRVCAIDAQGIPCDPVTKVIEKTAKSRAAMPQWVRIRAGAQFSCNDVLTEHVTIAKPGAYTVWYTFAMKEGAPLETVGKANPWLGTAVSTSVNVPVLTEAEYARRAGHPITVGELTGLSLALTASQPAYHIGEPLAVSLVLHNAGQQALVVPWKPATIYRMTDDGRKIVVAMPAWQTSDRAELDKSYTLAPGESVAVPMTVDRDYARLGVLGAVRYRAEYWLPRPAVTPLPADMSPQPVRTCSAELPLRIEMAEADIDRLLTEAARGMTEGKGELGQSAPLDTLCALLDRVAPTLPARAQGTEETAALARDLLLAAQAKTALADPATPHDPAGIFVSATGTYTFAPASVGALVGIDKPLADPVLFAQAFLRLRRCAAWQHRALPDLITANPDAPMESILQVARALFAEAAVQQSPLYRLRLPLPSTVGGDPYLEINSDMVCSMLVGVEAEHGQPVFTVLRHAHPDDHAVANAMWQKTDMPEALRALGDGKQRVTGSEALAKYLDTLPNNRDQVLIVPLVGARWRDLTTAVTALRAWRPDIPIGIAFLG